MRGLLLEPEADLLPPVRQGFTEQFDNARACLIALCRDTLGNGISERTAIDYCALVDDPGSNHTCL
jgi:hypothetical protein